MKRTLSARYLDLEYLLDRVDRAYLFGVTV